MKALSIAFAAALLASSSFAADPFTDAVQQAYGPYRVALFNTNGKSQPDSQLALQQAMQAWEKYVRPLSIRAVAPYDRDPDFNKSLAEVDKAYAKAQQQVAANQLSEAHETLEHVRDVLAGLRQRNQVVVFSDHMNAYHAEMEKVLGAGASGLSNPRGFAQLTAQSGALLYLVGRMQTQATSELTRNPDFQRAVGSVEKSVVDLQTACFSQDIEAAKTALSRMKAPYSKLFLNFG